MKIFSEKKAVKGFLELKNDLTPFVRKSYLVALSFFLIAVSLIVYLLFFTKTTGSLSSYILSFIAGGWVVYSYIKVTEIIGIEFVVKYLDYSKLEERNIELKDVEEKQGNVIVQLVVGLIIMIVGAAIVSGVMYLVDGK